MISAFAPAKINLTLHITGQRPDGYHLLDSLVVFVDVGDRLSVTEAKGLSLSVSGPLSQGVPTDASNLVLKAANLMGNGRGAAISLEKHLPAAAGIGGGSSDAAAALRALSKLWDVPLPNETTRLGADVPVCLDPRPTRMEGIGEILSPVPALPECWLVLVNPRRSVSTPEVFRRIQTKDNPPMGAIPEFRDVGHLAKWLGATRNDMQGPAIEIEPVIAEVLAAISAQSACLMSRMSGSGATCWGLFENASDAEIAAQVISKQNPDWWAVFAKVTPLS